MAGIKGTVVLKLVRNLRGMRERAEEVLPQNLHHYLETKILPSSWYPSEDYLELQRALARIIPDPGMDVFEFMGRTSARLDFEGIYKRLLRPGDPLGCLKGLSTLSSLQSEIARLEVILHEEGRATLEKTGDELIADEICRSQTGLIWETLNQSGATQIEARHVQCRARGDKRCLWEASWTGPATPSPEKPPWSRGGRQGT